MNDAIRDSDRRILIYAAQYTLLVASHRVADDPTRQALQAKMDDLIKTCSSAIEAEKSCRQDGVPEHLQNFVRERKPFDCQASASEAKAIHHYYATPPIAVLDVLTGEDMIALADHFEGWSQDVRLDQRAMIEFMGWSDGMRILAHLVGVDYTPVPPARGTRHKVPLLKFLAQKIRSTDRQ